MKWLDNITNIIATHNAGKCPFCNSENTDYRIINLSSDIGYGDVWCNDCKKAFHISDVYKRQQYFHHIRQRYI